MQTNKSNLPDTHRVVITGAGWVTPLGTDLDAVWTRLINGDSAIAPITHFDASTFATNFAAEVNDFDLGDFIENDGLHATAGLSIQYAPGACKNAFKQAGLDDSNPIRSEERQVGKEG